MASCLQFLTKVLKEPSPGTFKASGPGMSARIRPVETLPGEQAQADWGHFGYINMDGKRKHLYAFSFVLSYSRVGTSSLPQG